MAITALPTPPTRADPATFATRGDAFLAALPTFATEANVLAADVTAKQALATNAAVTSQIAIDAGLANAAANALTASVAASSAAASWAAALAANPDLNPIIRMNANTVSTNTTIAAGYNARSSGPLTINPGVSVTVEPGATWTIL